MAFAAEGASRGRHWTGSEPQVEDEFICSAALRGAVLALQPTVKRVFGVELVIAVEEGVEVHQTGLMWLQLKGRREDLDAAKLFVKGVVNQEEQQEVPYPEVLNCVFCGARGLFLDCLIRNTSAHILVGSPGFVLISGLAEPVVRAYSLIVDLVERYESSQGRRMDAGARGAVESLDSRRAFKVLVERWEDRHALDLLVLPASVKEVLLELVRDSRWNTTTETTSPRSAIDETELEQSPTALDRPSRRIPEQPDTSQHIPGSNLFPARSNSTVELVPHSHQHDTVLPSATSGRELTDPFFRSFAVVEGIPQGQIEGANEGENLPHRAQGWGGGIPQEVGEEASEVLVGGQDDFSLLLKFFTAMGFKEDAVKRVLARTGPRDACEILELVQQEQDPEENGEENGEEEELFQESSSRRSGDGAEGELIFSRVERAEQSQTCQGEPGERSPGEGLRSGEEEDFVLGVVRRAAASCGYTEERVREVCSNLPELSFHQLLLELQRQGERDGKPEWTDTTEADSPDATATHKGNQTAKESFADLVKKDKGEMTRTKENERNASREIKGKAWVDTRDVEKGEDSRRQPLGRQPSANASIKSEQNVLTLPLEHRAVESFLIEQAYRDSMQEASLKREKPANIHQHINLHQRTPAAGGTRPNNWNTFNHENHRNHHRAPGQMEPTIKGGSSSIRGPPRPSYPHETFLPQTNPHISATPPAPVVRPPHRQGLPPMATGAVVTGSQRFLEGLQTPFELTLTDDLGDPTLRQVIIDGSNVAMSHGLGQFFSCRGIALAVQHFWDRGHRNISALVPQWRQKKDAKVKEQHYLTQLQDLGLLSFTPSRVVPGKRINPYDDRFMLQLAQKTGGVIVTNDNMRDLFDESHAWKDIIRKSLLQYTFVGDHFMVPDDPLGRDGPHLNDFLRSQQRSSISSSHPLTGAGFPFTDPLPQQHPQSDPLQFRVTAPGGSRLAPDFQSDHPDIQPQGPAAGPSQGWEQRGPRRGRGGRGRDEPEAQQQRSAEETSRLRESLNQVFPDQASAVTLALQTHPTLTDVNLLSHFILEQQVAGQ